MTFDARIMPLRPVTDPHFKMLVHTGFSFDGPGPSVDGVVITERIQHTQIFRTTRHITKRELDFGQFPRKATEMFREHCAAISHYLLYSKGMDTSTSDGMPLRQMCGLKELMGNGEWVYPSTYELAFLKGRSLIFRGPRPIYGIYSEGKVFKMYLMSEVALYVKPGIHRPVGHKGGVTLQDQFHHKMLEMGQHPDPWK